MQDCKSVSTLLESGKRFSNRSDNEDPANLKEHQSAIGSLTYASIATRPDLSVSMGELSKFMGNPNQEHWCGVKRVLTYIQGTLDFGLEFTSDEKSVLYGYSDADWGGRR